MLRKLQKRFLCASKAFFMCFNSRWWDHSIISHRIFSQIGLPTAGANVVLSRLAIRRVLCAMQRSCTRQVYRCSFGRTTRIEEKTPRHRLFHRQFPSSTAIRSRPDLVQTSKNALSADSQEHVPSPWCFKGWAVGNRKMLQTFCHRISPGCLRQNDADNSGFLEDKPIRQHKDAGSQNEQECSGRNFPRSKTNQF